MTVIVAVMVIVMVVVTVVQFCTGSFDNTVMLWDVARSRPEEDEIGEVEGEPSAKRQKKGSLREVRNGACSPCACVFMSADRLDVFPLFHGCAACSVTCSIAVDWINSVMQLPRATFSPE